MRPFPLDRTGGEGVHPFVDLLDQTALPELFEIPEPPIALIGWSTERVEIPFTEACRITATKAFSAVRRASGKLGR